MKTRWLWNRSWVGTALRPLRRAALWLALGPGDYGYMRRTLAQDGRLRSARMVDIVVRKDAVERRMEADWLKRLGTIVIRPKDRERADRLKAEYDACGGKF